MPNAAACQLPPESRLQDSLPRMDYQDSFEVPSRTPKQEVIAIYAAVFGHLPKVFKQLLVLRSHLVKPLGIAGVSYADLAQPIDTGRGQDRALAPVCEAPGCAGAPFRLRGVCAARPSRAADRICSAASR